MDGRWIFDFYKKKKVSRKMKVNQNRLFQIFFLPSLFLSFYAFPFPFNPLVQYLRQEGKGSMSIHSLSNEFGKCKNIFKTPFFHLRFSSPLVYNQQLIYVLLLIFLFFFFFFFWILLASTFVSILHRFLQFEVQNDSFSNRIDPLFAKKMEKTRNRWCLRSII